MWLTRTLHLGGSQKKIACSQRMFKASQVDRLAHGAYLAAKAWNSRILLQWLHESAVQAATLQNFDSAAGRTLGVWLAEEVRAGRRAWPTPSDTPFLFLEPLAWQSVKRTDFCHASSQACMLGAPGIATRG